MLIWAINTNFENDQSPNKSSNELKQCRDCSCGLKQATIRDQIKLSSLGLGMTPTFFLFLFPGFWKQNPQGGASWLLQGFSFSACINTEIWSWLRLQRWRVCMCAIIVSMSFKHRCSLAGIWMWLCWKVTLGTGESKMSSVSATADALNPTDLSAVRISVTAFLCQGDKEILPDPMVS